MSYYETSSNKIFFRASANYNFLINTPFCVFLIGNKTKIIKCLAKSSYICVKNHKPLELLC